MGLFNHLMSLLFFLQIVIAHFRQVLIP